MTKVLYDASSDLSLFRWILTAFTMAAAAGVGGVSGLYFDGYFDRPHEGVKVISPAAKIDGRQYSPQYVGPSAFVRQSPETTTLADPAQTKAIEGQSQEDEPHINGRKPDGGGVEQARRAYQCFLSESDPVRRLLVIYQAHHEVDENSQAFGIERANFIIQLREAGAAAVPELLTKARAANPLDAYQQLVMAQYAFRAASYVPPDPKGAGIRLDYDMATRLTGVDETMLEQMRQDILPAAGPMATDEVVRILNSGGADDQNIIAFKRLYDIALEWIGQQRRPGEDFTDTDHQLMKKGRDALAPYEKFTTSYYSGKYFIGFIDNNGAANPATSGQVTVLWQPKQACP